MISAKHLIEVSAVGTHKEGAMRIKRYNIKHERQSVRLHREQATQDFEEKNVSQITLFPLNFASTTT